MKYWMLWLKGPIWAFAVWEGRDHPTWCVYADPEIAWMRGASADDVRKWLTSNKIANCVIIENVQEDKSNSRRIITCAGN